MANTIGWGEGSINNTIGWGQATKNNTIGYGEMEKVSWTGETNITGLSAGFQDTKSFAYDGVDDKLQTASTWDALDGNLITNGGFTISVWVKLNSLATTQTIWRSWDSGGNVQTNITVFTSGQVQVFTGGSSSNWSRSIINLVANQWYHIVFKLDPSISSRYDKQQIYINGRKGFTSNFYGGTMPNGFNASLGLNGFNNTNATNGNINEFAVWSQYVLTDAEIDNIYNNGVPNDLADTNNVSRLPDNWVRSENGSWNGREWDVPNFDDATNENWLSYNMNEDARQNDVPTFNTKSIELDGVDDRAESSANYTALAGDSQATFSLWFKLQKDTTIQYPLSCYDIPNARFIFGIRFQRLSPTDVRAWFYLNTATNNNRTFANLGSLNADGQWHHLMIGMDLTRPNYEETNFYLDGVQLTQNGYTASAVVTSFNGLLTIGNRDNTYSGYYGGYIDEVAIYSGVDLSNDVATIYNNGVPNDLNNNGLTAPTTYYRCGDGDTSPTIIDRGTSGYDLTMTNFSAFSNDVPT